MFFVLLLHDKSEKLANGAIVNLVDEVGGVVIHEEGLPMNVSVDMSISFLSYTLVGISYSHNSTPFISFHLNSCLLFC